VNYGYDLNNRLTGVSDGSAAIPAAVPPSGTSVQYVTTAAYDILNRPTGVSWTPPAAAAAATGSGVTFTHTYNKANQRVSQTVTDNSWINYPAATPAVSYTANALNQYSAVGAVTPSYNANGNLTFDGTFTFGYDAENRLTSAVGAGNTASYTYDAQGRRKTRTVNGTTTVFVTDAANREVLEYDGSSGAILRWYAYGLGSNDVLNQTNVAAGTRTAFIPDIQGSVIASLDSTTATLTKIGYLPYGKGASATGPFGYTGQRIDPETNGLYYYRARHYSPAWGRFLQVDRIGYGGGNNLYTYVGNDPLNCVDITGNEKQFSIGFSGTIAGFFLGAGASATVGVSVPDNISNLGGYQVFGTLQAQAGGSLGGYLGVGVVGGGGSTSNGPLPIGSASKGWYVEVDAGAGPSVGASVQGPFTYDPAGKLTGLAAPTGGSVTPLPKAGYGLGLAVIAATEGNVTVATPTFGQIATGATTAYDYIANGISSLMGSNDQPQQPRK
jgi:RHS repeat-associated protein